jgi:prepilin-type N-terminal cleavage/methylation domain-containing protein
MTQRSAIASIHTPLQINRGVTLIELMIVLVIIGIMISLLFPAIQSVRQSSLRTSCQNNRRNLETALHNYILTTKRFPGPPIVDRPSGWAIEILPYVEAQAWKDQFHLNASLSDPANMQAAGQRPDVFRCPLIVVTDGTVAGIPAAQYTLAVDLTSRTKTAKQVRWHLRDASVGTKLPWCFGPEVKFEDPYEHPHPAPEGGLNSLVGD